jgi:hypothetical protein
MNTTTQHKFTHLGLAPYRLVNYYENAAPDETDSALMFNFKPSYCDHCGRPITHVFVCKSKDGKLFNLGSEHVKELGDDNLTREAHEVKLETERRQRNVRREQQRLQRLAQSQAREQEILAHRKAEYARIKQSLHTLPHPNEYFASQGKTLWDYYTYFYAVAPEHLSNEHWLAYGTKLMKVMELAGAQI